MRAALVRNSLFNLAGQGISILAALVCIPITFRHLGTERFGLLMLVWGMLSYAIVFDLGTGPAVARATAASLVTDKGRRIAAILKAGITLQLALGAAVGFILVALSPWLIDLLNVPAAHVADARLALVAVALALPVVLITQSQQAVLEGLERFDLLNYVRSPVNVASYVIPAVGAVSGWSLARIMFIILATRIIGGLIMYGLYRATLPSEQNGAARGELAGLFRYGRWLAISGVLAQLPYYFDRFVLSATHGVRAVAQYAAPYDAAIKLLVLPGSIGVAMFPALAKDAARNKNHEAGQRCRAATRVIMLVLAPICGVLLLFAPQLLRLWLGPQLEPEGITAFRILLLVVLLNAAAYPPIILIEALGRSDAVARYHVVQLIAYVPLALFAISRFGVVGTAWACVARTAALTLWSVWYARAWLWPRDPVTVTELANVS